MNVRYNVINSGTYENNVLTNVENSNCCRGSTHADRLWKTWSSFTFEAILGIIWTALVPLPTIPTILLFRSMEWFHSAEWHQGPLNDLNWSGMLGKRRAPGPLTLKTIIARINRRNSWLPCDKNLHNIEQLLFHLLRYFILNYHLPFPNGIDPSCWFHVRLKLNFRIKFIFSRHIL